MNKKKKKKVRIIAVVIAVLLVGVVLLMTFGNKKSYASQFTVVNSDVMDFNPFNSTESRLDNSLLEYGKVLNKYASKGYVDYSGDDIELDLSAIQADGEIVKFVDSEVYDDDANGIKYLDNRVGGNVSVSAEQYPNAIYSSASGGTFTIKVTIAESGLYSLDVDYLILDAKDADMYLGLYVDGKLPFLNASNMALKRMYSFYNTDASDSNNLDVSGNQIRPKQQEIFGWQSQTMTNPEGLYKNPYKFYLKAGEHVLTFKVYNQPGVIGKLSLVAPLATQTYDEYVASTLAEIGASSQEVYNGGSIRFELENLVNYTNGVSIRMEYDNDYASSPVSYKVTRYNVFGGERWADGGDGVEFKFTVATSGWYKLGFRYQSIMTNVASYKEIKIDGEIPFDALVEYSFPYASTWCGDSLKDADNNPYLFYFEAGEHTIQLTNKVGPLRHTYQKLGEAIDSITVMVNEIAKITSSTRSSSGGYVVDQNRDWDLDKYIPDIREDLVNYVILFEDCYAQIQEANGGMLPSYGSAVKVALELFDKLASDIEEVPSSLNDITSALTGLSNTMVSVRQQAITLDYMVLSDEAYDYSEAYSTAWQDLYVGIIRFKDTFIKDYKSVGSRNTADGEDMKTIEVYISRGREYVDILKNMVAEQFTPDYGVKVNVNMVTGEEGLIMKRYVAGTAPDVAINVGAGTPFEFSVRGALYPLNKFDKTYTLDNGTQVLSFQDLIEQSYYEEALVPYIYQGNYYAFPETQSWSALFYRTDILEELGVEAPDTWEDVYELVPILTKDGYSFYFPYGVGGVSPFLYQNGGEFYDEDGLTSALNSNAAYDAFVEYANLYLQYNFTYAADFYMRFKNGEMPIGIADVSFFCKLNYSAPELAGKWAILPVPGHTVLNDEGEVVVDRSTSVGATCGIIISSTKYPDESWQFLQWWLSDEVQIEYGREVEATFGVASRWTPANKNAAQTLPYTQDELDVINAQWEWIKECPNVLGGYYTSRYLLTALNQTVLQGMNARVSLEDAIKEINKEMLRKQEEYGIYADQGGSVLRASKTSN